MKKLLVLLTLVSSMSAFADCSQCKDFYVNHFQRLNLISTLVERGEISAEFQQTRLADEQEIVDVLGPIMCQMSEAKRLKIKNQVLSEMNGN